MPLTERGRWAATTHDERGRVVVGSLTERGAAVKDGYIKSLDDKVTAYIAENSTTNVVTRPTPRRQQVAESAEAQMASVQDTRDEMSSPRSVAHYPRVRRATASEDDR